MSASDTVWAGWRQGSVNRGSGIFAILGSLWSVVLWRKPEQGCPQSGAPVVPADTPELSKSVNTVVPEIHIMCEENFVQRKS